MNNIVESLLKLKQLNNALEDLQTDGINLWNNEKSIKLYGFSLDVYMTTSLTYSISTISSTELLNVMDAINTSRHIAKDFMMVEYMLTHESNWDPSYGATIINTWLKGYYQLQKYVRYFDTAEQNNVSIIINKTEALLANINEKEDKSVLEKMIIDIDNDLNTEKLNASTEMEKGTSLVLTDGHPSLLKDDNDKYGYVSIGVIMYIIANIGIMIATAIMRH